jgi:hypothetical protein
VSDNERALGALLMEACGYEPGDTAAHAAQNDLAEDRVEFVFKALDFVRGHMAPHTLTIVEQASTVDEQIADLAARLRAADAGCLTQHHDRDEDYFERLATQALALQPLKAPPPDESSEWVDKDGDIWVEVSAQALLVCVTIDGGGERRPAEDIGDDLPRSREAVERNFGPLRRKGEGQL